MKRILKATRKRVIPTVVRLHSRLPRPVAGAVLLAWASIPAVANGSGKPARIGRRLGVLMVQNSPDTALSLAGADAVSAREVRARNLARAMREAGSAQDSVGMLRRAVELHPASADLHAELGMALRRFARGLDGVDAATARQEAEAALMAAIRLEPDAVRHGIALAALYFDSATPEKAIAMLRELHAKHRLPDTAMALGRAYQRTEVADFDAAAGAYQDALELDPQNDQALTRLNSVTLRTGSWAGWHALVERQSQRNQDASQDQLMRSFEALFHGEGALSAAALVDELQLQMARSTHFDHRLLHGISARLQAMGEFGLGFAVRETLAERIAQAPNNQVPHPAPFGRWTTAMVTLDRAREVLARYDPYPWRAPQAAAVRRLDKIHADARFSLGDPALLAELARDRAAVSPTPHDERMANLVRGKRVAIVGPGVASGEFGREIDDFDVIIRPRFSHDFVQANRATSGSRTDIAYYSGTDVHTLLEQAAPAAESGSLKLVVARPLSRAALSVVGNPPWLRFYRHDYSLILNGGPLGITRIAYDVAQFEPSTIAVYNVDYYTGAQTFATGYRTGRDAQAVAGSIVMDLFRAHDLLADFKIHRNLFQLGVLSGPPAVTRITALTPEEYTLALERAWKATG